MQSRRQQMFDAGIISEEEFNRFNPIGSEHDDIDVEVDGTKYVEHKINSMKAHRSQFKNDWWGFNIPDEFKEEFLGYENYILAFNRGDWSSPSELIQFMSVKVLLVEDEKSIEDGYNSYGI